MFVVVVVVFAAVTVVVVAVAVVVVAVAVVVVVVVLVVRCRLLLFLLTRRSNSGFRFFRSCFYDSLIANALPVPCYNRFTGLRLCRRPPCAIFHYAIIPSSDPRQLFYHSFMRDCCIF